jgi:hypothetical protein
MWSYCGHAQTWSYKRHTARRSYSQLATRSGLTSNTPQCGLTGVVPQSGPTDIVPRKPMKKCAAFHLVCGFITSLPRKGGTYSKHATQWSYSGHATKWTYSWHATWWCRETEEKCTAFPLVWFSHPACHATAGLTASMPRGGLTAGMPHGGLTDDMPQGGLTVRHASRRRVLQQACHLSCLTVIHATAGAMAVSMLKSGAQAA